MSLDDLDAGRVVHAAAGIAATSSVSAELSIRSPLWARWLKIAVDFALGRMTRWLPSELRWLFDLRDAALHHGPTFSKPVPHPLGTHTSPEYVEYAHENATRAVSLTIDLMTACLDHPKNSELEGWANNHRPLVDAQAARRRR
jgi:hypothetical protein